MRRLLLASTSPYRRELLARLGLPFETLAPRADETPRSGEPPRELALRLARAKAESALPTDAVVIGSDQVPSLDGRPLAKPGSHAAALEQLLACQGKTVAFYTAVVVIDAADGRRWETVDRTDVAFRTLGRDDLDRYLAAERPYDCAGGFKAEGLGVVLFERIVSEDPTALIGLPLIALARMLREAGLDPLAPRRAP
ncbi:MAG TPA: Maf family nucleotide pyrophosphatase [Gammaproteobacteria bacterium]